MEQQKSRKYMIYELQDAIKDGIEKNTQLLELENEFLTLIEEAGKKEKFQFMLEDYERNRDALVDGLNRLKHRLVKLEQLIEIIDKPFVEDAVSLVFEAIGATETTETEQPQE